MGRPPGDGFSPSRGWLVSGLYVGRACALRLTTTSLPRVTGLTLEVSPDPPLRGLWVCLHVRQVLSQRAQVFEPRGGRGLLIAG